ncbi:MAG: apolipoprotein N-acyltransferase [Sulfitobacter sp.]|nr:apolipoprotein N-acyltransferase [Sulfitobacter sp.]
MPLLGAALLGAIGAFGQAPYDLPIFMMLALIGIFFLYRSQSRPRRAALLGWAFGVGYFAHALQWIVSPFLVDVARHGWMAPFALLFLSTGLALLWGGAFALARWLEPRRNWPLIFAFTGAELLRASLFTGFPWAMPAQALVDSPAGQGLAWLGPHGLNLAMFAVAYALAGLPDGLPRRGAQGALALGLLALLFLPMLRGEAGLTGSVIRLVQPNAAQHEKWDEDLIPQFFERQLQFTAAPPTMEGAAPDLILWSETAIPWRLDYAGPALEQISAAGGAAPVALGLTRSEAGRYYNSLAVLDRAGQAAQIYDKHHLVPFGEYVPLAGLLNRIGIFGLAQRLPGGYASGEGPALLDLGALGQALPLICYEAVFPRNVRGASARPDFLIQITNDAWFGRGAGPRQHLAQARMRAIEQGLPLARAANTGISAMIDPRGRVTAALALNQAGFVDAALPAPLPPTLYSRTGDLPLLLLVLVGLLGAGRLPRGDRD